MDGLVHLFPEMGPPTKSFLGPLRARGPPTLCLSLGAHTGLGLCHPSFPPAAHIACAVGLALALGFQEVSEGGLCLPGLGLALLALTPVLPVLLGS